MTDSESPRRQPGAFATTHWTQVLAARGDSTEAKAALSDLCDSYYGPVLAFIKNWTRDEDKARDLTHDFFSRILATSAFDRIERGRSRFRSYLLGAVKHFLADARDREQRLKRGGGATEISLSDDPASPDLAPTAEPPSDSVFDRQWALTVMERALDTLQREFTQAGKSAQFDTLKPWLAGESGCSQAETAKRLDMNEGAVKVAIHRIRRRFREMVKHEIAQTVEQEDEVRSELNYLIETLAGR